MPPPPVGGCGEVGGWVVFRKVVLWEAQAGVGCTGRPGEGGGGWFCVGRRWSCSRRGLGEHLEEALGWDSWWEVLCGDEVELQQARPGRACGRGSGMVEVVGSWRSVVFRKVTLGGPSCRIGAEWSWDQ